MLRSSLPITTYSSRVIRRADKSIEDITLPHRTRSHPQTDTTEVWNRGIKDSACTHRPSDFSIKNLNRTIDSTIIVWTINIIYYQLLKHKYNSSLFNSDFFNTFYHLHIIICTFSLLPGSIKFSVYSHHIYSLCKSIFRIFILCCLLH